MAKIDPEALRNFEVGVGQHRDFDVRFHCKCCQVIGSIRRYGKDSESEIVNASAKVLPTHDGFLGAWAEGTTNEKKYYGLAVEAFNRMLSSFMIH